MEEEKDMPILGNRQVVNSPVNDEKFIWVAEYYDGTHIAEYDFTTKAHHNFYAIDKNKVIRFGLVGEGNQIYFDVGNGVFTLNNHRITVSYEAGGIEYPLTGRAIVYNDLITYKDAIAETAPYHKGQGAFSEKVLQYNVGYKKEMELLDVNIHFQSIFTVPMYDAGAFMQIKISANKDLDGKLIFRRNGNIVDQIYAPLKAFKTGQVNWSIK